MDGVLYHKMKKLKGKRLVQNTAGLLQKESCTIVHIIEDKLEVPKVEFVCDVFE